MAGMNDDSNEQGAFTLILDFINPAYDRLMSNNKNSELHISILDDYKI